MERFKVVHVLTPYKVATLRNSLWVIQTFPYINYSPITQLRTSIIQSLSVIECSYWYITTFEYIYITRIILRTRILSKFSKRLTRKSAFSYIYIYIYSNVVIEIITTTSSFNHSRLALQTSFNNNNPLPHVDAHLPAHSTLRIERITASI